MEAIEGGGGGALNVPEGTGALLGLGIGGRAPVEEPDDLERLGAGDEVAEGAGEEEWAKELKGLSTARFVLLKSMVPLSPDSGCDKGVGDGLAAVLCEGAGAGNGEGEDAFLGFWYL